MKRIALAIMLSFTVLSTTAYAVQIGPGAFGPGAGMESFEGLSASPPDLTLGTSPRGDFLIPSFGFTLPSGVSLTGTGTNLGLNSSITTDQGGVVIGNGTSVNKTTSDCLAGTCYWDLLFNGHIFDESNVPFGDAFVGMDDNLDSSIQPIEFSFGLDMLRVGAYVTAADCSPCDPSFGDDVTLRVFKADGTELESLTISGVGVGSWGTNFIGIGRAEGIRKVQFSGNFMVLDKLMFEPVPEPATLLLLGTGLTGLAVLRRRKRIYH